CGPSSVSQRSPVTGWKFRPRGLRCPSVQISGRYLLSFVNGLSGGTLPSSRSRRIFPLCDCGSCAVAGTLRSPEVTKRNPSLSNARREPKLPLAGPTLPLSPPGPPAQPFETITSFTLASDEPPSQRARATARVARQVL